MEVGMCNDYVPSHLSGAQMLLQIIITALQWDAYLFPPLALINLFMQYVLRQLEISKMNIYTPALKGSTI